MRTPDYLPLLCYSVNHRSKTDTDKGLIFLLYAAPTIPGLYTSFPPPLGTRNTVRLTVVVFEAETHIVQSGFELIM